MLIADDEEAAEEGDESEEPKAVQVPQQLELPLPDDIKEEVKAQWEALAASVDSLRPIERYQVVGIAYRRHALFKLSIFMGLNLAHCMAGCVCLCCRANALTGSA